MKCWCDNSEVGVATATPAIQCALPMEAIVHTVLHHRQASASYRDVVVDAHAPAAGVHQPIE